MSSTPNSPAVQNFHAPDFKIIQTIQTAFSATRGAKTPIIGGIAIQILIFIALGILVALLGGGEKEANALGMLINIIGTLIGYLLYAGLIMLGVKHIQGHKIKATMVLDYFGQWLSVIMLNLLITIIVAIGFIFFVLPGIYFIIAYSLAVPVMLDKKLGVWEAMETSRKMVTSSWFRYFFTYILMGIVSAISAIPLGIGLIWTVPMCFTLIGILYYQAFDDITLDSK